MVNPFTIHPEDVRVTRMNLLVLLAISFPLMLMVAVLLALMLFERHWIIASLLGYILFRLSRSVNRGLRRIV